MGGYEYNNPINFNDLEYKGATKDASTKVERDDGVQDDVETVSQSRATAVSSDTWQAFRGAMLYDVLSTWGARVGTEVLWGAAQNFKIQGTVTLDGTFEEAVTTILEQYNEQYTRPVGNLHLAPTGQKTLVIVSYQGA